MVVGSEVLLVHLGRHGGRFFLHTSPRCGEQRTANLGYEAGLLLLRLHNRVVGVELILRSRSIVDNTLVHDTDDVLASRDRR